MPRLAGPLARVLIPRLFRFLGLLVETRYIRFPYRNEGLTAGKIAYKHFTVLFGLTVNVGK